MAKRDKPANHAPDDGEKASISRRALLAGAAGAAGAALVGNPPAAAEAPVARAPQQASGDPSKVLGRPASEVGQRAEFERPTRFVSTSPGGVSRTPLQDLDGIITPSDLHYERHHAGVPRIDPATYSLLIHGMVERPMMFTLEELKRFPSRSRLYFLECSGNGGGGFSLTPRPERSPQQIDGLVSTSEWIGVPLATLFRECGASPDATWFLAEGMDAALMTRSIPVEKAWDDAMIVYGQNGEAIRPEQGYPARLFLPGWEGNACVKWIRRIELSDRPFMTRDETSKYSDPLSDDTARIFSFEMDAKSIITNPSYPARLAATGWHEITGVAWSGRGKITGVDVSVDDGRTWATAELDEPVLSKCQTRFRYLWNRTADDAVIMSRATDDTGYVQPFVQQLRDARGVGTRYHYNSIRAWTVRANGTVVFGRAG
jgi:sulfane dehydrogenase subunit SoxC